MLNPFFVFLWWSLLFESVRERIISLFMDFSLHYIYFFILSHWVAYISISMMRLTRTHLIWFQFRHDISLLSSPGEAPRCSRKTIWWEIDWWEKNNHTTQQATIWFCRTVQFMEGNQGIEFSFHYIYDDFSLVDKWIKKWKTHDSLLSFILVLFWICCL